MDWICKSVFEEVIDGVYDEHITSDEFFKKKETMIRTAACCIRPLGIFLTCLGFFLLFSPVIAVLKWIPLVGWLLGGIVALAAAIFAAVIGSVISILVIAIAWVVYRPLVGIILFSAVGITTIVIFAWPAGKTAAVAA